MEIFKLLLAILLLFSFYGCSKNQKNEQPNVLLIFIDDMGFADPGCFGNNVKATPNIDRIANNGIKFINFYVNSPICSPSRVALATVQQSMKIIK